jgi:heptosyltransferase-2
MKILFITLSNIGDCILTLPVLDALRQKYPEGKITCVVPARPAEIFKNNPAVDKVVIFDKKTSLWNKITLFSSLSKEKFDLVIDLRNSFFGAFLPAKERSSPFRFIPRELKHSRDRHLFWAGFPNAALSANRQSLKIRPQDIKYIEDMLGRYKLINSDKLIVIAPGARSQLKCWDKENFSQLASLLANEGWDLILAGDKDDQATCSYVADKNPKAIDFSGKTSIIQLAHLLKKAKLLITNDSAVMHLASYLNVPVVSIFGPTNELKYGPWPENKLVIKKDIACRPCEKALCRFGTLDCLTKIRPLDAFAQIKIFLANGLVSKDIDTKYRRILILRNDRIGDVLLSTPVIKALRQKFPQAYISMLVAPVAKDIVEGNPYLDEVITYDKDIKHKKWMRTLKFAARLKKKKFDLAVNLHPTNRTNILIFLAGIPVRLGYNRKLGFLLTHRKEHLKQEGLKHETEYNFDLLKVLDISGDPSDVFMPIKTGSDLYADDLFRKEGIKPGDNLLAINPGASCPSKIWPVERFAEVCRKLADLYNFKILILAGPKDMVLANKITLYYGIKGKVINLAGKISLSQMASIIKRCSLFISNDSGPVHMASALGTPVISIFGRNQPGLSPKRWGPLGKTDKYLHKKEAACIQCLAHNCKKEFACLKAISVEDVISAAQSILS